MVCMSNIEKSKKHAPAAGLCLLLKFFFGYFWLLYYCEQSADINGFIFIVYWDGDDNAGNSMAVYVMTATLAG